MTRALVTQMQSALEGVLKAHRIQESRTPPTTFSEANAKVDAIKYAVGDAEKAINSARDYLATEPSGERSDSAQWLREFADMEFSYYSLEATQLRKAADMLEADVSLINEGNKAQQAKRVPMTDDEIDEIGVDYHGNFQVLRNFARAIESHIDTK